jgi:hypothetical protein
MASVVVAYGQNGAADSTEGNFPTKGSMANMESVSSFSRPLRGERDG